WDDMGDALRRALVHAVRAGDERERTTIVIWLQVSLYYGPTTVDAAIEHCRNVLETETSHRVVRAMTACRLAGLLAMRGSFDEARELGRRGTVALDDLGLRVHAGHARAFVADSEFLAGDPA